MFPTIPPHQLVPRTHRWADLPLELVLAITAYLDTTRDRIAAMCACRPWRDAIAATTTSLAFQLAPGQRATIRRTARKNNALVSLAAHHCTDVKIIIFGQWHGLEDGALVDLLTKAAPRVEDLCMPSCTMVTDAALRDVGGCLAHVRRLVLSNCMQLTDASMMVRWFFVDITYVYKHTNTT